MSTVNTASEIGNGMAFRYGNCANLPHHHKGAHYPRRACAARNTARNKFQSVKETLMLTLKRKTNSTDNNVHRSSIHFFLLSLKHALLEKQI